MKYLDREPVEGDRVHVEFDGTVIDTDRANPRFPLCVRPDAEPGAEWDLTSGMVVRVLAPEPKVGDVVTADVAMGLPDGTVIEAKGDSYFGVCIRDTNAWWRDSQTPAQPIFVDDNWRIVRIGGAS